MHNTARQGKKKGGTVTAPWVWLILKLLTEHVLLFFFSSFRVKERYEVCFIFPRLALSQDLQKEREREGKNVYMSVYIIRRACIRERERERPRMRWEELVNEWSTDPQKAQLSFITAAPTERKECSFLGRTLFISQQMREKLLFFPPSLLLCIVLLKKKNCSFFPHLLPIMNVSAWIIS